MPAKKMKKAAASADCKCMCHKGSNIQSWFLILLGAVGLANAMGILMLGIWSSYFQYVWPAIVIVVGMTMLMKDKCGCC